jgi:hypothetical protein
VPLLAAIGLSGDRLRIAAPRRWVRRAAPIGLVLVALLLGLRAAGVHARHGGDATMPAETGEHHHIMSGATVPRRSTAVADRSA